MHKGRLEAFTDAVIAIIMTIMVLELKAPHSFDLHSLQQVAPSFLCYVLSFIYLAIYWNNHHHMMHSVQHINGAVLWATQHLLFWLSLIPFTTAWMAESKFAPWPVAIYGIDLLLCAIGYYIVTRTLLAANGPNSSFARHLGSDVKGKISTVIYMVGVLVAYFLPWLACVFYFLVTLIWLVPDKRFAQDRID